MTLTDYYRTEQDAPDSPPAISRSTDSGMHGGHCYSEGGTLVCGWPELHAGEVATRHHSDKLPWPGHFGMVTR